MARVIDEKYALISIHDVTPKFSSEVFEIVSALDERGIKVRNMGVVPNYDNKYDISKDDNFASWLLQQNKKGIEIFLHGYNHQSECRRYSSPKEWFRGEVFSKGEAEFQNINYEQASDKIEKGMEIFDRIGISYNGFIPPCWITNRESARAIEDAGFRYVVNSKGVKSFQPDFNVNSKVLFFSSQNIIIDFATRAYDKYLQEVHIPRYNLVSIPIHPRNIREKKSFDCFLKTVDRTIQDGRKLTTYDGFLDCAVERLDFELLKAN
jgi:uncharacterized protein